MEESQWTGGWVAQRLGVPARAVARAVASPALAAMAMALAVWLVDQRLPVLDPVWRLAVLLAVGGVVYAGWMLAFARAALGELVAVLRKRPVAA